MMATRTVDPHRLTRRSYTLKVPVEVDEDLAVAIEQQHRDGMFKKETALETLQAFVEGATKSALDVLAEAGREKRELAERAAKITERDALREKLRALDEELGEDETTEEQVIAARKEKMERDDAERYRKPEGPREPPPGWGPSLKEDETP